MHYYALSDCLMPANFCAIYSLMNCCIALHTICGHALIVRLAAYINFERFFLNR